MESTKKWKPDVSTERFLGLLVLIYIDTDFDHLTNCYKISSCLPHDLPIAT